MIETDKREELIGETGECEGAINSQSEKLLRSLTHPQGFPTK